MSLGRDITGTPLDRLVSNERVGALVRAVELEVDREDVELRSPAEERLWHELELEFEALVAKLGRIWVAA